MKKLKKITLKDLEKRIEDLEKRMGLLKMVIEADDETLLKMTFNSDDQTIKESEYAEDIFAA
jgi:hypothetical protein